VIAAGATITADVPPDTLAIARTAQVNRPGWASRQRAMLTGSSAQAKRPVKAGKKGKK
jgi:bifunctional UDP-N-acetylglucosamine pyrophosphorylase/glucosamine-1-phosphate N-acetyltransferase